MCKASSNRTSAVYVSSRQHREVVFRSLELGVVYLRVPRITTILPDPLDTLAAGYEFVRRMAPKVLHGAKNAKTRVQYRADFLPRYNY